MLTTFERHLFRQFLLVNAIYLCVVMALFTVIDLFDNVDDFMSNSENAGFLGIASRIAIYYGRMGMFIFDAAAIPMIAVSALTVLLLAKRRGQVKPFLSAGISTYRVVTPALLLGAACMVGIKMMNREVFLSDAVHHLHAKRGGGADMRHILAPRYDHASKILIDGAGVIPEANLIERAAFVLPPEIVGEDMISLKADQAKYYSKHGKLPGGWVLKQTAIPFAKLPLTKLGRQYVLPTKNPGDIFVVSDVSPDLIYKAKESSGFLSTTHLVQRINSPAIDSNTARDLEFNLHSRVVEPFLTALMVCIAIPLILQRESRSMIANAGKCGFWLFTIIGSSYAVAFLASSQVVEPIQAAWLPLFFAGPLTVWMLDRVEA